MDTSAAGTGAIAGVTEPRADGLRAPGLVTAGAGGGRPEGPVLAVIDMQRFFAAGSAWAVPGFEDLAGPVGRLVRGYGPRAVFTRFVIPAEPEGSWVGYYHAWPAVTAPEAGPLAELAGPWALPGRPTVDKPTFSKWGPELGALLGPARELSVCGVSTDCCVLATVLAAVDGGAQVRVIADACAGITAQAHEQALSLMAGFAPQVAICSVDEELARLRAADARR